MTKVKVYAYRNGTKIGYTVDPTVFPPPRGWKASRPFEFDAAPAPQGMDLKRLIAGLDAQGFYIP